MSQPEWRLLTTPEFDRAIRRLDRPTAVRILRYLTRVVALPDPRTRGKGLTADRSGQWRYRIGDYRVLVEIQDGQVTVLALTVGHRSEVY